MLDTINARAATMSDAVLAASRQVWFAGLGAAVVTREWATNEAGNAFRALVREGTAVESRAFRQVGDGLDRSFSQVAAVWNRARSTVGACADYATSLVRGSLASKPAPARKRATAAKRKASPARKSGTKASTRSKRSTASAKRS